MVARRAGDLPRADRQSLPKTTGDSFAGYRAFASITISGGLWAIAMAHLYILEVLLPDRDGVWHVKDITYNSDSHTLG